MGKTICTSRGRTSPLDQAKSLAAWLRAVTKGTLRIASAGAVVHTPESVNRRPGHCDDVFAGWYRDVVKGY